MESITKPLACLQGGPWVIHTVTTQWVGPPLCNIEIRIQRRKKHRVAHELGIEPGLPGSKPNALPTKSPLLPMIF